MKSFFKKAGLVIANELSLNLWSWLALVAYALEYKEVALSWILAGIYFKSADILDEIKRRNLVSLSMTITEEKGETS